MNRKLFGDRLRKARNEKKLTAEQAAELCDVNATYFRHIECGVRTPSLPVFITICNVLSVSPTYLLQDQLEHNELDDLQEFAGLWKDASPDKQQMILKMLRAALEE